MRSEKPMKCSLSRTRFSRGNPSRGGFTFAEVLAALVFLGILLPVVMQGLVLANRASILAERKRIATHLGDGLLTELVATDDWQFAASRGNFQPEHMEYQWELVQSGWFEGDMLQLTVRVTFPVQGRPYQVELATLVDNSS